jgi:hypothetical protein
MPCNRLLRLWGRLSEVVSPPTSWLLMFTTAGWPQSWPDNSLQVTPRAVRYAVTVSRRLNRGVLAEEACRRFVDVCS